MSEALPQDTVTPRRALLLVLPLVALGLWLLFRSYTTPAARECIARYRAAKTAADTARVDQMVLSSRESSSCGFMRIGARWQ